MTAPRRAVSVMVLGTASHVGKSLVTAAICRILMRRGVRVAPFKAQNMSLNSAATPEGLEIGRAQALQAEAAGLAPRADMNPVLLKPFSKTGSQAIINGRIYGTLDARDFLGGTKRTFWPHVVAAYERLASEFDVLVIEGAGSPAEINLRAGDIVNMSVAHLADARCLLVADIDRGGAFAAVAGTMALLDEADRSRIIAYAFNKFRGDATLLDPGIAELSTRTRLACAGVVPFIDTTGLDEEDGVAKERRARQTWRLDVDSLRVAVVALPHLANFTDFDALEEEPEVDLIYSESPGAFSTADVLIIPGTKDTIADLRWLRERGIDTAIAARAEAGAVIIGICGGMQMLGESVDDPLGVESGGRETGLGLLPLRSSFAAQKTTIPVHGVTSAFGPPIAFDGYEIHVGVTTVEDGIGDDAVVKRERALGTYVHGLFAVDLVRHAFLRWARGLTGKPGPRVLASVEARRAQRIDALADVVESALDLRPLLA